MAHMDIQKIYRHKKPISMLSSTVPTTLRHSHKHQTLFLAKFHTRFHFTQFLSFQMLLYLPLFMLKNSNSVLPFLLIFCLSYHR